MPNNQSSKIDIGFNLFAYAAIGGKNLEQLDRIICKQVGSKKPYGKIAAKSGYGLVRLKNQLMPVAEAIGINGKALLQTQEETVGDLGRRLSSVDSAQKLVGANVLFSGDGRGAGTVVCYVARAGKTKMIMEFDITVSARGECRIRNTKVRFPIGEREIKFQLKSNDKQMEYFDLMRQFDRFDRLEAGLDVFGGGYEAIAEHLVKEYRKDSFRWSESEVSRSSVIRSASFGDEEYAVRLDDDEERITVSSIWSGRFRLDALCGYSDQMELDLATICDVSGYEQAVLERETLREEERQREEAERQAEIDRENALRELEIIIQDIEARRIQATASQSAERVVDLTSAKGNVRPVERVHIGDLVVKTWTNTCKFENHEIREVIALINVFDPRTGISEVAVDAFCCPTCKRYYVLEDNFAKVTKRGSLCCRVVVKQGGIQEFIPSNHKELAEKSFFKQLGYSVGKEEGLYDRERRAILDFAIANGLKTQKQTISFLEWLVRFNGSQKNMSDAVRKWESDIKYLISNKGKETDRVKIDRVYLTKHEW